MVKIIFSYRSINYVKNVLPWSPVMYICLNFKRSIYYSRTTLSIMCVLYLYMNHCTRSIPRLFRLFTVVVAPRVWSYSIVWRWLTPPSPSPASPHIYVVPQIASSTLQYNVSIGYNTVIALTAIMARFLLVSVL